MKNKTLLKIKSTFLILSILILSSCEKPKILNSIPDEYLGKWTETSDEILKKETEPKILTINNRNINILGNYWGERSEERNIIQEIKEEHKNKLVITCIKDKALTTEITIILKEGFVYVSEFIHSGVSDSDGNVYGKTEKVGKFYLK